MLICNFYMRYFIVTTSFAFLLTSTTAFLFLNINECHILYFTTAIVHIDAHTGNASQVEHQQCYDKQLFHYFQI